MPLPQMQVAGDVCSVKPRMWRLFLDVSSS